MRVLLILLMFLSGCASKPPEPVVAVPGEYFMPMAPIVPDVGT